MNYDHLKKEKFNQYKLAITVTLSKVKRILDIGCGNCEVFDLITLENPIAECLGVEPELANEKYSVITPEALHKNAHELGKFDLIQMSEVIEHTTPKEAEEYIRTISKVLSDDGLCVIATPNPKNLNTILSFYDIPDHVKPYSASAIRFMAEKHGLVIHSEEQIQKIRHPIKSVMNKILGFEQGSGIFITLKKQQVVTTNEY